jgi:protocatechuate 3,4-dioxygenase beta subunit
MEKLNFILALIATLLVAVPAFSGGREETAVAVLVLMAASAADSGKGCQPTPPDALGPFYKPGAPVRDRVGEGYVLSGVVRAAGDCAPIPGARVEFWLAGPDGNYDDAHRATLFADPQGAFRFESNFPPRYSFRPPHIHIRVTAEGFRTLVTQHYPAAGKTAGIMDLVLVAGR